MRVGLSSLDSSSVACVARRVDFCLLAWVLSFVVIGVATGAIVESSFAAPFGTQASLSAIDDGDVRSAEARSLIREKKWDEAVIVLRPVVQRRSGLSTATLDLSKALTYSGRREEALSVLLQASNREKGGRRILLIRRARVLSRQFITTGTQKTYQEGLNFMLAKKYRQARERFDRAHLDEPDNIEVLTRMGQCLILDGDHDSAAERLRAAKRLNPHEPEIRLWLGRALHQRGELIEAVIELKAAYTDLKDSELAPVWLADAYASSGQRAQAISVLEEDVKNQPFHLRSLIDLARLNYLSAQPSSDGLWSARRQLQLALSRFEKYSSPSLGKFESELGFDVRLPQETKGEITTLLQKVETKLEALSTES